MRDNKTERVTIRLTKDLRRQVLALAKADKRHLSPFIEILLEEHVAKVRRARARSASSLQKKDDPAAQ